MANNTYVALDSVTISGTSTSSVVFNSFSGYTDLRLVISAKSNSGSADTLKVAPNTSTSISRTYIIGNGSTATSGRQSSEPVLYADDIPTSSSSSYNLTTMDFMDYANTTTNKTVISRLNNASATTRATVYLIPSTNAITSLTLSMASASNIGNGSTFSLYGIRAEGVSPTTKATGGAVYSDSTYYYHVFGASGTFTPTQSITADVLVVAGGAGGGRSGGGGGAGGYLAFTSQALTATGYTVTVGSGGAGNNTDGQAGTSGGDSQFGALTLVKGGGGGGSYNGNGASGASGGGGGSVESATKTGGSATPSGQGNAGGNGFNGTLSTNRGGGGGGGAGDVGAAATSATGGNGGIGLSTYSSWGVATGVGQNVSGTYYLSGGGGGYGSTTGGSGGSGGGGGKGVNGTANTGGGGGGSASDGTTGFSGGSGVVIVRYAK